MGTINPLLRRGGVGGADCGRVCGVLQRRGRSVALSTPPSCGATPHACGVVCGAALATPHAGLPARPLTQSCAQDSASDLLSCYTLGAAKSDWAIRRDRRWQRTLQSAGWMRAVTTFSQKACHARCKNSLLTPSPPTPRTPPPPGAPSTTKYLLRRSPSPAFPPPPAPLFSSYV